MAVLNEKQLEAYKITEEGHNLVVIGQAGTGKSVFIRETQSRLAQKGLRVSVVASTGMASTKFPRGTTLHSWPGLHDAHLSNQELIRQLPGQTAKGIFDTDVLIADETSMTSAKIFDQVEFICRNVRQSDLLFGGLQVICVGDWFQLPPVANKSSNDPGQHCFTSRQWKMMFKHKVVLTEVFRQTDQQLVRTINEVERREPSDASIKFVKSLERPLPAGEDATFLYGTNFDVDWHNASELKKLPGVMKLYRSEDSGDVGRLSHVTAKKSLYLKVDCPVILLRNMGKGLVNGLRGIVTSLDEDGPCVRFPHGAIKLQHVPFTVYNYQTGTMEAERHQYPIVPAFALTIHKAQGLTIPRLVVDCKNIFSPGQAGVAIGRAVSAEGLQVLNFTSACCRRHPEDVYDFFEEPGSPTLEDLTCCEKIPFVEEEPQDESMKDTAFPEDDDEYDEVDMQAICDLEAEHQENEDVPSLESKTTQAQDPSRIFTCEEAVDALMSVKPTYSITKEQRDLNEAID